MPSGSHTTNVRTICPKLESFSSSLCREKNAAKQMEKRKKEEKRREKKKKKTDDP